MSIRLPLDLDTIEREHRGMDPRHDETALPMLLRVIDECRALRARLTEVEREGAESRAKLLNLASQLVHAIKEIPQ